MVTTVRVTGASGAPLAVHHLGGDGPPVMLAHATGFHGRCWEPLAEVLTPFFTVWALDQRGHGSSAPAPGGEYDWELFAADLLAVVESLGAGPWRAGGHSLGGGVSLLAEARRPGTFQSICCYEPVVVPPGGMPDTGGGARPTGTPGVSLADLARKRRSSFPTRREAWDNYRSKPPFSRFDERALVAYVEHGFVDEPDGTVTLACRREDEAATFDHAPLAPTWDLLPSLRPPVAVLAGSDPSDPVGRLADDVARRLPRGGFRRFGHLDHFGPLVAPAEVGVAMAAALGAPIRSGPESTKPVTSPD